MIPRHRVILQLESELGQARAATADGPPDYDANEDPAFYEGYWRGRIFGLESALSHLKS